MAAFDATAQPNVVTSRVNALYKLCVCPVQPVKRIDQRRFRKFPTGRIESKNTTYFSAQQRTCIAGNLTTKTMSD